jgi:hypothetical protein
VRGADQGQRALFSVDFFRPIGRSGDNLNTKRQGNGSTILELSFRDVDKCCGGGYVRNCLLALLFLSIARRLGLQRLFSILCCSSTCGSLKLFQRMQRAMAAAWQSCVEDTKEKGGDARGEGRGSAMVLDTFFIGLAFILMGQLRAAPKNMAAALGLHQLHRSIELTYFG